MLSHLARHGRRASALTSLLHFRGAASSAAAGGGGGGGCGAPPRDARFARVTPADVAFFRSVVGDAGVVTDPHALEPYNRDWMGRYTGAAPLALRPTTTAQVSALLARCAARRLAVVPQGGNTGLVGGSVPVHDEVVLSLAAMDSITSFDADGGAVVCQAGVVLERLDAFLAERGHAAPLDLGAKGSCLLGGNVATNAGGTRLLRYGSLHGSVLGLEVVLADGTVLDMLTTLRKDNTGPDLKHLFIGSEGTLGVVTAVALACPPRPAAVHVAWLAVPSFEAALRTLALARARLGEVLSAFEFLDAAALRLALAHLPGARDPLAGSASTLGAGGGGGGEKGSPSFTSSDDGGPFFLVVEASGSDAAHDGAKVEAFLEAALAEGAVADGVVAADLAQAAAIWRLREGVPEALRHRGPILKYDVSLPAARMYDLVRETRALLARRGLAGGGSGGGGEGKEGGPGVQVVGYGHLGDGNLHLNVSAPRGGPPASHEALRAALEPWVYARVAARRGSVSAEHGLGRAKAGAIGYTKPPPVVALARRLKAALDPAGILNPYKVLPPEGGGEEGAL